jgi:hypothetical protein
MSLPARWFGLRTVSDRHGAPSQGRSPTKEGCDPNPARGSRGLFRAADQRREWTVRRGNEPVKGDGEKTK